MNEYNNYKPNTIHPPDGLDPHVVQLLYSNIQNKETYTISNKGVYKNGSELGNKLLC
jgi:hypothetical protein